MAEKYIGEEIISVTWIDEPQERDYILESFVTLDS